MKSSLGVFVKFPQPGRVKTRLASRIGDKAACRVYEAFLQDWISRCRAISASRVLYFTPDDEQSRLYFQALAKEEYELLPQPDGDLGTRQEYFFQWAAARGDQAAIVTGSDSPNLPLEILQNGMEVLNKSDVVIGPATDGGYYLLGQRIPHHNCFEGISWSSETVLQELLDRLPIGNRLKLHTLPMWYDVDTTSDLQLLATHLRLENLAGRDGDLPNSSQVLADLGYNPGVLPPIIGG